MLRQCLAVAPVAWAMPRAQEAALLRQVALPAPVLDIGCGDGAFAGIAGRLSGALGVDLDPGEVRRARARGVYGAVLRADAGRLPFRSGSFGSVVSISTLEHIAGVERVLAEAARVLRPGGRLVCSMPGREFDAALFWSRVLRRLGGDRLGRRYETFVDRVFRHVNLLELEQWTALLSGAGFRLLQARRFNPPVAVTLQDLAYPGAAIGSGVRRLTGRWSLVPPLRRPWTALLEPWLRQSLEHDAESGTCYFLQAESRLPSGESPVST
jgi:SAM-dependent methyltransferase